MNRTQSRITGSVRFDPPAPVAAEAAGGAPPERSPAIAPAAASTATATRAPAGGVRSRVADHVRRPLPGRGHRLAYPVDHVVDRAGTVQGHRQQVVHPHAGPDRY